MCQFLETIKVKNKQPANLDWHQLRVNQTFKDHYPNIEVLNLIQVTKSIVVPDDSTYKLRIIYSQKDFQIELAKYLPKKIEKIGVVKIADDFNYHYKFAERNYFNQLLSRYSEFDDLLLIKNGLITDSTYANLIFKNNNGLFTPTSPLLAGTARARMLASSIIKAQEISLSDLRNFSSFFLILSILINV